MFKINPTRTPLVGGGVRYKLCPSIGNKMESSHRTLKRTIYTFDRLVFSVLVIVMKFTCTTPDPFSLWCFPDLANPQQSDRLVFHCRNHRHPFRPRFCKHRTVQTAIGHVRLVLVFLYHRDKMLSFGGKMLNGNDGFESITFFSIVLTSNGCRWAFLVQ